MNFAQNMAEKKILFWQVSIGHNYLVNLKSCYLHYNEVSCNCITKNVIEINLEALTAVILVRFSCTGLKLITPACQFSCFGDFDIFPQWNNLQFNQVCLMICCIGLSIWLFFLNHYCQKVFSVNDLYDPFNTWKNWDRSAVTSQNNHKNNQ